MCVSLWWQDLSTVFVSVCNWVLFCGYFRSASSSLVLACLNSLSEQGSAGGENHSLSDGNCLSIIHPGFKNSQEHPAELCRVRVCQISKFGGIHIACNVTAHPRNGENRSHLSKNVKSCLEQHLKPCASDLGSLSSQDLCVCVCVCVCACACERVHECCVCAVSECFDVYECACVWCVCGMCVCVCLVGSVVRTGAIRTTLARPSRTLFPSFSSRVFFSPGRVAHRKKALAPHKKWVPERWPVSGSQTSRDGRWPGSFDPTGGFREPDLSDLRLVLTERFLC